MVNAYVKDGLWNISKSENKGMSIRISVTHLNIKG